MDRQEIRRLYRLYLCTQSICVRASFMHELRIGLEMSAFVLLQGLFKKRKHTNGVIKK